MSGAGTSGRRTLSEMFSDDSAERAQEARKKAKESRMKDVLQEKQLKRECEEDAASVCTRSLAPSGSVASAVARIVDAHRCMSRHGIVILESSKNLIDNSLLQSMSKETIKIEKLMTDRLKDLKISFSNNTLSDSHIVKSTRCQLIAEAEKKCNFKYKEVYHLSCISFLFVNFLPMMISPDVLSVGQFSMLWPAGYSIWYGQVSIY